jgi:hypothetical protein
MTTRFLTGTYASGYTLSPAYSALELKPSAAVYGSGVYSGHAAFIGNYGKIETTPSTSHQGVLLAAGGRVRNGSYSAYIRGAEGVQINGGSGSVYNVGTIVSTVSAAVYLTAGGRVANGSKPTDPTHPFIEGATDGVVITGGAGTLINYAAIYGQYGAGVVLGAGSVVNATTTISNLIPAIHGSNNGVEIFGVGTVTNAGEIVGYHGDGVFLSAGGQVSNSVEIGGGLNGVYSGGPATVNNSNTINGTDVAGVNLESGGSLSNAGHISGAEGVLISGGSGNAYNVGSIVSTGSAAVDLTAGGLVANGSSATNNNIPFIQGATDGVDIFGGVGTLINFAYIRGRYGEGVLLDAGGSVVNATTTISSYIPHIYGSNTGVAILGGGTVTNAGVIVGQHTDGVEMGGGQVFNSLFIGGGSNGVYSNGGATVNNSGTINGTNAAGVNLEGGGSVSNAGLITGAKGVLINGGAPTVNNSGTIDGTVVAGVNLESGGSVSNAGLIRGADGISISGGAGSVTNQGTVLGGASGIGVYLEAGGTLTNEGRIDGAGYGVVVNGSGVLSNTAGGSIYGYSKGLKIGAAHVTNLGAIESSYFFGPGQDGVILAGATGGLLVNGSASDQSALVEGSNAVLVAETGATVINFGYLHGYHQAFSVSSASYAATLVVEAGCSFQGKVSGNLASTLDLGAGSGTISNLGGFDETVSGFITATTFYGFGDLTLLTGAQFTVTGTGTIAAGGGTMTNNGSLTVTATLSDLGSLTNEGGGEISVANAGTLEVQGVLSNAGTIAVAGTTSVTRLRVLAGGASLTGGGTVSLGGSDSWLVGASAAATLTNVDNTIAGVGLTGGNSLTLVNQAAGVIDAVGGILSVATKGTTLTNAGLLEASGGGTLVVDAGAIIANTGGTILAANGSRVDLQNDVVIGGTVGSVGTGLVATNVSGGEFDGSAHTVTLSGVVEVNNGFNLILNGAIANTGKLELFASTTHADLIIGAAGATLSGGGQVVLSNSLNNRIYGQAASDTLTNVNNTIVGAGLLGAGTMTLINEAGGTIAGNSSNGLTINTGTNTIQNAGLIENFGSGGALVVSALNNTGQLVALTAGTLTLKGAVTGTGTAQINGGALYAQNTFTENVTFTGSTGTLELAHAKTYTGTITGLSSAGTNAVLLDDVTFDTGKMTAKYVANGGNTGGVLTILDAGVAKASINLTGTYTTASFALSQDAKGGTQVIDPSTTTSAVPLTLAMASFQVSAAPNPAGPSPGSTPLQPLVSGHG